MIKTLIEVGVEEFSFSTVCSDRGTTIPKDWN